MAARVQRASKLFSTVVHLEDGGAAALMDSTAEFWKRAHSGSDTYDRLLFALRAESAEDVHSSMWEKHPVGDEVICLLTGAVDVVLEEPEGERTVELRENGMCVVPRGLWHRLILHAPSDLLFVNSRAGMEHRRAAPSPKG